MTQQFTAPQPLAPAPQKKKQWFKKPLVWVPALTLLTGIGIGSAGGSDPAPAAAPAPTPAVTVTAPAPAPVTKTVEKTPAACIKALDLAQEGFGYSTDVIGYLSTALTAAGDFDTATIEEQTANMKIVNPKISALSAPMQTAVAECRAAAK